MHDSFRIKGLAGKKTLSGKVKIHGAKNAILQAFATSLLFKDSATLANVPAIEDTQRMIELLTELGITITPVDDHTYTITLPEHVTTELPYELSRKLRASIVLTGPVLAREGTVAFPHPGGCVIGNRPIDIFLDGFEKMGATLSENEKEYSLTAPKNKNGVPQLRGAEIFLRVPSVTATQTFMMAAVLAEGRTVIKNAALEPETESLADFLNECGAKISGAGTTTITIEGGEMLSGKGKTYTAPPDRIEAGSFLILGALAADHLVLENCNPNHVEAAIDMLKRAGVPIETTESTITIKGNGKIKNSSFKSFDIKTHEYPGFPTDLQAPAVVFLTQASGDSLVFETIFEGRLNFTEGLIRMGADIKMWDTHRITVKGPTPLKGRDLEGPDIRAGLAYIIAGIVAKGESVIHNAYYIDRGYQKIENRLRDIGVDIERITTA